MLSGPATSRGSARFQANRRPYWRQGKTSFRAVGQVWQDRQKEAIVSILCLEVMSHSCSNHRSQKPRSQGYLSQTEQVCTCPQLTEHIRNPGCKQHCTSTVVQDLRVFANSVKFQDSSSIELEIQCWNHQVQQTSSVS